jgi:hypothetical protein
MFYQEAGKRQVFRLITKSLVILRKIRVVRRDSSEKVAKRKKKKYEIKKME